MSGARKASRVVSTILNPFGLYSSSDGPDHVLPVQQIFFTLVIERVVHNLDEAVLSGLLDQLERLEVVQETVHHPVVAWTSGVISLVVEATDRASELTFFGKYLERVGLRIASSKHNAGNTGNQI